MNQIFNPKNVAIIGASSNIKKWGGAILAHMIESGYQGKIIPINKNEDNAKRSPYYIQGYQAYPSVLQFPGEIECAVIAIPAIAFNGVLEECGIKGIKGIIAITAGFKEIGNKEQEIEAVAICKKYGMRMMGPNTLGVIAKNFNASFMGMPKNGNISFIAQSGTMCIALVETAIQKGIGLNKIISLGNQSDIDIVDLLQYLNKDEGTKVIVAYIEGIERGKEFIAAAKNIKKPIIIMKAGRSAKGAKAAFSHTGSMAGSDKTYEMAFKQAGVLRINEISEIIDISSILSISELPRGRRVGIITNGGGAGILASDLCEKYNIDIPNISEETKVEIKRHITGFATASNPTDTAAQSTYDNYNGSIKAMMKDDNIDSLICIYVHTSVADSVITAKALIDAAKESDKPVIACWFGGAGAERGVKLLQEHKIPVYDCPEVAVRALSYLLQQKAYIDRKV